MCVDQSGTEKLVTVQFDHLGIIKADAMLGGDVLQLFRGGMLDPLDEAICVDAQDRLIDVLDLLQVERMRNGTEVDGYRHLRVSGLVATLSTPSTQASREGVVQFGRCIAPD